MDPGISQPARPFSSELCSFRILQAVCHRACSQDWVVSPIEYRTAAWETMTVGTFSRLTRRKVLPFRGATPFLPPFDKKAG